MAKKIEMLNDRQQVVHPLTSSDCVIMENGKTLEEVMGDGIATPTVTHEGASFQVGVGDSNIEVVDGDVAGMTLEGQTYQNILPKPTTLIMETDEKEFKINDKIDNNIVLDDNVAEIATIKGQTYVNVVQEESASEYVAIDEELNGQSITTTGKPEGYVKNATLEGLTLVNTIQEPSGADATVLELDANIDAQYATIDNTVQGGIHGVALKGQTLVNIHKSATYSLSRQNEGWYENLVAETNRISFEVTDTSTDGWRYLNLGKLNLDMLKPNTKYLVYFGVANFPHNLGVRFMNGNATDKISNEAMVAQGSNWAILTTSSEIIKSEQVLYVSFTNVLGKVEVGNAMIIEYQQGMENWDISYFEGMQSVEVPSVKTTGKNLFDGGVFYTDIIGNSATGNCELLINGLKIKKNTEYVISFEYETDTDRPPSYYCILTKTKQTFDNHNKMYTYHQNNYLDGNSVNKPMLQFNSGEFEYLYLSQSSTASTVDGYMSYSNIQLEKGSTVTTYEPYKSSTAKVGLLPILETEKSTYYSSSSGNKFTNPAVNTVKYKVQGLSKVYVKVAHSNFSYWDANNTYIGGQATIIGSSNNAEGYLNIPTNAVYMRCAVDNTKIAEVYEAVVLRKVGDVQDELDLETGKLTQRIGEYIITGDGKEVWNTNTQDNCQRFSFYNTDIPIVRNNNYDSTKIYIICDKLRGMRWAQSWDTVNTITTNNGSIYMQLPLGTTMEQAKSLMDGAKIQYRLENEIIHQVDLSIVDQSNKSLKTIQAQPTLTHITTSSNGLIPFVSIPSQLKYPTIIKPSTQYTLKLKRDVVDSANQLTVNVGGVSTSVTSDIMTITTPDTLTSQDIVLTGKNNVVSKLQLIEGDVTGIDYPFFEGMLDVKSPKLLATGKNLFDKNSLIFGAVAYSTGEKYSYRNNNTRATLKLGSLIRVEPNSTITLSCNSNFKCVIQKYDENEFPTAKNDSGWQNKSYHTLKLDNKTRKINIYFTKQDPYSTESITNEEMQILKDSIQVEYNSTATSYEPYKGVTIEQDIDSIPLTSDMFEQGAIDDGNTSTIVGMSYQQMVKTNMSNRYRSKQIIPVKPNGKYILNCDAYAVLFDKNGAYVKNGSNTNIPITNGTEFTIPSYVYYIAPCLKTATINSNLTLQEVPQEIVLRSLPNGVKDTLNLTTGEYVQRIGEVVFDGSDDENWFIHEEEQDNYINKRFRTDYLRGKILYFDGGTICNIICDKVQCYPNLTWKDDREGIEHDSFYVSFRKNCETVTKFKQCLSQDPITIQYQLITPIIKKVNLTNATKLPSYNSTTHYDTIVPSNSLIPNIKLPSTIDYNVAIKPSTQYTVRCNTTNALSVNLGGSVGTLANGKVTLTTPSTLAHNSLKLGNGKAKEVMVIEGSEIKDNVPFFNGMKNVQMGGIKLVNIARGATVNGLVTANANKTQFTYTSDGSTSWGSINFDKTLLKPNTVYTVYCNIAKNTSDNTIKVQLCNGSVGIWTCGIPAEYTGVYKITLTSPPTKEMMVSTLSFNCRNSLTGTSGQQVVIQNPMVIEGDWTHLDEIPYIESEMIIEQPIIRSQGKNLFDLESKEFTVASSGTTFTKNGTTYTITGGSNDYDYIRRIWSIDNDKWLKDIAGKQVILSVSSISTTSTTAKSCVQARIEYGNGLRMFATLNANDNERAKTFIIPSDIKNLQLQLMANNSGSVLSENCTLTVSNIQLELGSTATSYEPFKHQTLYSNRVIAYEENCYYANGGGFKLTNTGVNSMLADVEGLSIAYVVGGSSNFTFWDKDNVFISGKAFLDTALSSYDKNGFIQVPSNAKYMRFASGNETTSNTYKTATVTGELPLRSLPSGVCDSFNLVTGEYVQRIGEVVLDGSSDENWIDTSRTNNNKYRFGILEFTKGGKNNIVATNISCDSYIIRSAEGTYRENHGMSVDERGAMFIYDVTYSSLSLDAYKQYLSQNPVTVQYELATPIVRKIGLTAKGVFAEASLGDCDWVASPTQTNHPSTTRYRTTSAKSLPIVYNTHLFTEDFDVRHFNIDSHGDYEYISNMEYGQYVNVRKERLESDTVKSFKKWLAQNPIKVGYITWKQTSSSYSNIQKPIFFNNVNVQFMNNNVDIQPQITFQARSRNSYVMDMMKPNTLYTVKAFSNPHNFYIDGKSYGKGTNSCITTPTLTNRLLVTGSSNVQELMIIEGDVTSKQLPYYKGIRSAYDDVDRVEMLSQTRNLFNYKLHKSMEFDGINFVMLDALWEKNNVEYKLKPNTKYTLRLKTNNRASWIHIGIDGANESTNIGGFANGWTKTFITNSTGKITIGIHANTNDNIGHTLSEIQLEEGTVATPYQPHQHNTTSLPMPTRLETVEVVRPIMEIGRIASEDGQNVDATNAKRSKDYIPVEPDMILMFMNGSSARAENVYLYGINKNYISAVYTNGTGDLIIPEDCYFIRIHSGINNTSDIKVVKQQYKPIALNSLPNGVKDEIIIEPVSNKAKLIQRVGKVVFDGSEGWSQTSFADKNLIEFQMKNSSDITSLGVCDKFIIMGSNERIATANSTIYVRILKTKVDSLDGFREYLKREQVTVCYELTTPVVHEIRLTGFPFVYEDGSVQLNTELPHKTLVDYNVNQEQLINNQNETIIRHDKQIDNLYDYIELYLEEEYRMELFRMQLELSL